MIENYYNNLVNTPSDINEHLPTLRKYAEECDHITEMGVRWIVSTYAFLAAKPKTLISIDIQPPEIWNASFENVKLIANEQKCKFNFILDNTLKIKIKPTDLLFIDTWHAYKQLKSELNIHHNKVKKYIILHDTTSYEYQDEKGYESLGDYFQPTGEGIWLAIEEFLQENKNWILHERFTNNNGLTILKKI